MVKGLFLRSAAIAAMIAAGTVAVPAAAQDVDRTEMREQRMERRAERQAAQQQAPQQAQQAPREARQENRQQRQTQAAPEQQAQRASRQEWRQQRQAQQAAPQQQDAPQQRVERSGSDRRLERYTEGTQRDRALARSKSAPAANADTGQDQQRGWRGRDGSTATAQGERNRSYADRDRNGSYRDGNRGAGRERRGDTLSRDRNGSYRSGYRDGRTADSYRDNRDQRQAYRSGYRSGNRDDYRSSNDRRWDNNWRRDNRYNWSSYRNQHRNIYRAGRYYSPYRNYSYSRLSIGFFLDSGFYGNNYWVNDPWQYRLPEVYGPYKWVRYYDDVILVDIYTGEVVDVIHNFFW